MFYFNIQHSICVVPKILLIFLTKPWSKVTSQTGPLSLGFTSVPLMLRLNSHREDIFIKFLDLLPTKNIDNQLVFRCEATLDTAHVS